MTKKKKQITRDTGIMDALELNPDAADILAEAGLGCIGCSMAAFETLQQGLEAHGFKKKEIEKVMERLNK
jgi:hybrid cluster-associated redox disulfide protein